MVYESAKVLPVEIIARATNFLSTGFTSAIFGNGRWTADEVAETSSSGRLEGDAARRLGKLAGRGDRCQGDHGKRRNEGGLQNGPFEGF